MLEQGAATPAESLASIFHRAAVVEIAGSSAAVEP